MLHQPSEILIVDDILENIQVLSEILKPKGYKVRPVLNGKAALKAARLQPPDLILLDINMPGMNGYEVCEQLNADDGLKEIPVIFISAMSDALDKVRAFSLGAVDYITKPFQMEEVLARVENHLRLYQLQLRLEEQNKHLQKLVREQVREITSSQMATILALAKLAEYRDSDTGRHLERVQTFCQRLSIRLSEMDHWNMVITPQFVDDIFQASPLHDIGKVGIPDQILLKPARLTSEEFEVIKHHATIGANIMEAVQARYPQNHFIGMGIVIARSHHEKWDGSGYPDGLVAEEIPLSARILTAADVYDAMRSQRPYKRAYSHEETCQYFMEQRGRHFDPDIVDVFLSLEGEFKQISENLQ